MFFKDLNYKKLTKLSKKQAIDTLLNIVSDNPDVTNKELSKQLCKSLAQVKRYLRLLTEGGILTSELSYVSYFQEGTLKIYTTRKLTACNIKKSNQ